MQCCRYRWWDPTRAPGNVVPHYRCDGTHRAALGAGRCVTQAGHVRGQDVSVAGNMLAEPQVVQRTLEAPILGRTAVWRNG